MQLTISSIPLTFASKWTRTRVAGQLANAMLVMNIHVCKIHASSVRVSSRRVSRDTSIASCINNRNYPILEFSPIADVARTRRTDFGKTVAPLADIRGSPDRLPCLEPGMARRN